MDRQLTHHEINWAEKRFPLIVACDNWRDPRNVGMAFRLADALGVAELWLGGDTPAPPNRKLSRAARQTDQWVPFRQMPDLAAALKQAREDGYTLIGLEITERSKSIYELDLRQWEKLILVVGAESEGVGPEIIPRLDCCAHLPMFGRNTSLNVATALSMALGEIARQWNV
ncbi:MAG: hypothetical protein KDC54_06775 [Lewinella sp.]|nr:hypothetical protein [Lewinella sp.]